MENISVNKLAVTDIAARETDQRAIVDVLKTVLLQHGLQLPLTVCRSLKNPDTYEVVVGQRVLDAWKEAKMGDEILCEVREPIAVPYTDIAVFTDEGDSRHKSSDELRESIRQEGLLVPIVVSRLGSRFALIDGARRLDAWKNLYPNTAIQAVILERKELSEIEEGGDRHEGKYSTGGQILPDD